YYITYEKPSAKTDDIKQFSSIAEATLAEERGVIQLQTPIRVEVKGQQRVTTLGRVFFNEALPEDFPYVDEVMNRKALNNVMARIFDKYGSEVTAKTADEIKDIALQYA